jgi:hypothetical protein
MILGDSHAVGMRMTGAPDFVFSVIFAAGGNPHVITSHLRASGAEIPMLSPVISAKLCFAEIPMLEKAHLYRENDF